MFKNKKIVAMDFYFCYSKNYKEILIRMDRNYLIEITKEIYQLTLLFPKKEPLRYKIREIASEILNNFIRFEIHLNLAYNIKNDEIPDLLEDIEVLEGFFTVINEQNWVKQQDILSISGKYEKIKDYVKNFNKQNSFQFLLVDNKEKQSDQKAENKVILKKEDSLLEISKQKQELLEEPNQLNIEEKNSENKNSVKISPRQERIIDYVKSNGKTQVGDLKSFFPEITKRTLRRDFMFLLNQGMIQRIGEKNNTFYVTKES